MLKDVVRLGRAHDRTNRGEGSGLAKAPREGRVVSDPFVSFGSGEGPVLLEPHATLDGTPIQKIAEDTVLVSVMGLLADHSKHTLPRAGALSEVAARLANEPPDSRGVDLPDGTNALHVSTSAQDSSWPFADGLDDAADLSSESNDERDPRVF